MGWQCRPAVGVRGHRSAPLPALQVPNWSLCEAASGAAAFCQPARAGPLPGRGPPHHGQIGRTRRVQGGCYTVSPRLSGELGPLLKCQGGPPRSGLKAQALKARAFVNWPFPKAHKARMHIPLAACRMWFRRAFGRLHPFSSSWTSQARSWRCLTKDISGARSIEGQGVGAWDSGHGNSASSAGGGSWHSLGEGVPAARSFL
jgi:hypothetical protein